MNRVLGLILVVIGLGAPLASAADGDQPAPLRQPAAPVVIDGISALAPDDPLATALSIDDVSVTEGNAGSVAAVFTVSLDVASGDQVTVDYATSDGTALAPGDYQSAGGTITIPPGEMSATVTVQVNGDVLDEADETYAVTLSNPVNATIADGSGVGTIIDDDPPPSLSINDVAIPEGNNGNRQATFTVALSSMSGQTVTVEYATADGTATTADLDYLARSGTLTFEAGQTSRNVNVPIRGDIQVEPDETYFVNLSNPTNAVIADDQGLGTIINDDGPPPPPPPPPPPSPPPPPPPPLVQYAKLPPYFGLSEKIRKLIS